MPATADNLRDLHQLHQRARALQDRLTSGPKTLAARQAALVARQAELETARKALQDAKIGLKKHEHSLQAVESKIDDLKIKLNQVKKNEEYKALQNQIAHDNAAKSKLEEQVLQALDVIETKTAELAKLEADVKRFTAEARDLPATDRGAERRPQGPAPGARDGDHRGRDRHPRGFPRPLPPDRLPIWRRRPGGLRGWRLPRLLHRGHRSDAE